MKPALPKHQRGASLIEVLVAFLLLTLGLLGMSALQINALQNSHSSLQRSQATMLAHYMMDAMRANAAAARAGQYNLGGALNAPIPAPAAAGQRRCPASSAPAGTLAANDQIAWMDAMDNILGGMENTCGRIACEMSGNPPSTQCTVQVYWDDTRGTGGAAAQMIEIRSQL